MQHVVIGAGEVGQAVYDVLKIAHQNVYLRDIQMEGPTHADVLHICIPGTLYNFVEIIDQYQHDYDPDLTIVHSTVPIGTCSKLNAVHSPVRGRHPNLAESILTFVKFFGGSQANEAAKLFEVCGVPTKVVTRAEDTEAGKLWELLQYGIAIAVEKAIFADCQARGVDFETVYTAFAETYNDGYCRLGDAQFTRPVLRHIPGPIGGHCVVPGSLMLEHPLANMVAEAR